MILKVFNYFQSTGIRSWPCVRLCTKGCSVNHRDTKSQNHRLLAFFFLPFFSVVARLLYPITFRRGDKKKFCFSHLIENIRKYIFVSTIIAKAKI